jgi:hypothetical protein
MTPAYRKWIHAHRIEMITTAEQNDFHLSVQRAKIEGWLEQDDEVSATFAGPSVIVRCIRCGRRREQSYLHHPSWPYQFLRDLAHGIWTTGSAA